MKRPPQSFLPAVLVICTSAVFACSAATGDAATSEGKKTATATGTTVAARIGDTSITLEELDQRAASGLMKARQQEYEARQQALDAMINDDLLEREAKAKGVTKDKLIETEVTSKTPDATEAEIDAFYEEHKGGIGVKPKEEVAANIGAFLKSQKSVSMRADYMKSLRQKYGVKVMLEPPRVQIAVDDDAARGGPTTAPITIVEFSDFECSFCSGAEIIVDDVMKKYGDKVRLVYRDYPLAMHSNAEMAAMGCECADEQGKFWEMHRAMFADQKKLAAPDLVETAGGLGMDKDKFKACLDSGKYRAEVRKDFQDGQKAGVTGTPTFFVNGIMIVGARSVDSFSQVIDRELTRTK